MASKTTNNVSKISQASKEGPGKTCKLQLFYPVLAGCLLERSVPTEDDKDVKIERFYESNIHANDSADGDMKIVVCEFSAGQKIKETKILEISATYFVGISINDATATDEDRKSAIEEFVGASAWPMFRDLFIHIGSQSGDELPLLPNLPVLTWVDETDNSAT